MFALLFLGWPLAALSFGSAFGSYLALAFGAGALALAVLWAEAGLARVPWAPWVVFVPAFVLAVVSVATGFHNGLTDEPYAMPAFAGPLLHGHNPYVDPVTVTYNQYGTIYTISPTYVYLPVLIFLQPFVVSYKWFTVASWAVTVVLVRRRPVAVAAIGQGAMGLLAASGFNDFPVLLLLTLGTVGIAGRRQRWAEWLSLGCKQFANVFVIAYYAVRRDVRGVAVAVAVTVALALPFLLWSPGPFLCGAVVVWPSSCGSGSASGFFGHLNYWAWPIWAVGVFYLPLRAFAGRTLGRTRVTGGPPDLRARTDGVSRTDATPERGA